MRLHPCILEATEAYPTATPHCALRTHTLHSSLSTLHGAALQLRQRPTRPLTVGVDGQAGLESLNRLLRPITPAIGAAKGKERVGAVRGRRDSRLISDQGLIRLPQLVQDLALFDVSKWIARSEAIDLLIVRQGLLGASGLSIRIAQRHLRPDAGRIGDGDALILLQRPIPTAIGGVRLRQLSTQRTVFLQRGAIGQRRFEGFRSIGRSFVG